MALGHTKQAGQSPLTLSTVEHVKERRAFTRYSAKTSGGTVHSHQLYRELVDMNLTRTEEKQQHLAQDFRLTRLLCSRSQPSLYCSIASRALIGQIIACDKVDTVFSPRAAPIGNCCGLSKCKKVLGFVLQTRCST